jgi:hypothetical protein
LHTGRVYPEEKTTWPAQWEYLKKNGRTGAFPPGSGAFKRPREPSDALLTLA